MKNILFFAVAMTLVISCGNSKSNNNGAMDTTTTSGAVSPGTPVHGDTSSYERMSNKVDTSHHH